MVSATFKIVTSLAKKPALVFGPNLHKNIANLSEKPDYLNSIPTKIEGKNSNITSNDTKYWNLHTEDLSRNISKSGITLSKPVVSWIRSSEKNLDINDDQVDRNAICVVGKQVDMYPLALVIARSYPKFKLGREIKADDVRELSIHFISTDNNNSSDKSGLFNLIDNVREAARITDTPCNYLNTKTFEEEARKVVADLNNRKVSIEVFQSDELKAKGMGMIHSVGQASVDGHKSRMAILSFKNGDDKKNVCWVGKGIVYDTGGLSIKSKTGMPSMKADMGGAAGLLFAFKQAVQNNFTENLYCILCMAENSVGPHATRPDDIITAYSGLTVDINNTDAEGRLVLGDGVHYATKDLKADICLNMCTLTGAQGICTGKMHAGILTNNESYEDKLVKAGLASGDMCFPMLYCPELLIKEFDGVCSDLKNSVANRSNAQSSCAGHFIEAHLDGGAKYNGTWIHVDMAYPVESMYDSDRYNGFGVALMQKLFSEYIPNEL